MFLMDEASGFTNMKYKPRADQNYSIKQTTSKNRIRGLHVTHLIPIETFPFEVLFASRCANKNEFHSSQKRVHKHILHALKIKHDSKRSCILLQYQKPQLPKIILIVLFFLIGNI